MTEADRRLDQVLREYETEGRFLARRLTASAELIGPSVEDEMIAAIGGASPKRILDAGCGTGDVTDRIMRELSVEVVGVDLSPRMVELTRARGLSARVADLQALPFESDSFDCVLANRVLYHVTDLGRGITEISRVLRPGGHLVAVTYSDDHLRRLWDLLPLSETFGPLRFSAENGAAALAQHFRPIVRRDLVGIARFANVQAIRNYFQSYSGLRTFEGVDLNACLAQVSCPFEATYRHCLLVGLKPRNEA